MLDKATGGELKINLAANIKSLPSNDFLWCPFFFPELVWYSYFMILSLVLYTPTSNSDEFNGLCEEIQRSLRLLLNSNS
jgi:hypothetical protein